MLAHTRAFFMPPYTGLHVKRPPVALLPKVFSNELLLHHDEFRAVRHFNLAREMGEFVPSRQFIKGERYTCLIPKHRPPNETDTSTTKKLDQVGTLVDLVKQTLKKITQVVTTNGSTKKMLMHQLDEKCSALRGDIFVFLVCVGRNIMQKDDPHLFLRQHKPKFDFTEIGRTNKRKSPYLNADQFFQKTYKQFKLKRPVNVFLQRLQLDQNWQRAVWRHKKMNLINRGQVVKLDFTQHQLYLLPTLFIKRKADGKLIGPITDQKKIFHQKGRPFIYHLATNGHQVRLWLGPDKIHQPRMIFYDHCKDCHQWEISRDVRFQITLRNNATLVQKYTDGVFCPGIGPRNTTVKYSCGAGYLDIKRESELTPCDYIVVAHSRHLCVDPPEPLIMPPLDKVVCGPTRYFS